MRLDPGFWTRAHAYFTGVGITVERVLTDNGACYKSHLWRETLTAAGITHKRTRPYRPQTNGKVERLNRTLLDEWAYFIAADAAWLTVFQLPTYAPDLNLQEGIWSLVKRDIGNLAAADLGQIPRAVKAQAQADPVLPGFGRQLPCGHRPHHQRLTGAADPLVDVVPVVDGGALLH